MRGFGALETALSGPALRRPGFEPGEQRSADAAKSRVGRHVVVEDLPPTATIAPLSTAMSRELSGRAIQTATFSGVLLASHRARIAGSFP